MAVLVNERTGLPAESYNLPLHIGMETRPQHAEGILQSLLIWLYRAGEFALGLVLAVVGMILRAVLPVCVLAAPFIGLIFVVLLFGLLIEGFGLLLKAAGLLH